MVVYLSDRHISEDIDDFLFRRKHGLDSPTVRERRRAAVRGDRISGTAVGRRLDLVDAHEPVLGCVRLVKHV